MMLEAYLTSVYYWPQMSRDIKRYVGTCDICQKAKPRQHAPVGIRVWHGYRKPMVFPKQVMQVLLDFGIPWHIATCTHGIVGMHRYSGMATNGGRNLACVGGLWEAFKMDLVMIYNSQFHFLNLYLETKIIVKDSQFELIFTYLAISTYDKYW